MCEAAQRDRLLKEAAHDYAGYLQVDTSAQRTALDQELEAMLTRLEEYGSLLDRTRGESRHTLDVLVPQVYSHYQALQQTFQTIDHLEGLVSRVKEDLAKAETSVSQAEADLGASHRIPTVIRPLFFRREAQPQRPAAQLTFQPPEIFHTEDFFQDPSATSTSTAPANPSPPQ